MEKCLLQKKSSSVDIFILNKSSAKKVVVPKTDCPTELAFLKKIRSKKVGTVKKQLFRGKDSPGKGAPQKSSCSEEKASAKK